MAKELIIKLQVPDWADIERIKEDVQKIADELLITREQTASEARRFYEVSELKEEVFVPEDSDARLEKLRRKRTW